MSRATSLSPRFVEVMPEALQFGVLYVSPEYATVSHLCCCGCGTEVVTPLSPTDWKLTFDGVSISLTPSVGNWSLPCRSHYVIDENRVRWAGAWTPEEVERGRDRDRRLKEQQFAPETPPLTPATPGRPARTVRRPEVDQAPERWRARLTRWLRRLGR